MIIEETVVLSMPFDEALGQVKAALAAEGFGVLTEIDLQDTLRRKTGKEMDSYVIIGACNPHLAGEAIDIDPELGVLLPCNVVVRQAGDTIVVDAIDPGLMSTLTGNEAIEPIAKEARRLIDNALMRVMAAG